VIDPEIVSTVFSSVPLLWYVQKLQFLAKLKATGTGKLPDSLPMNDTVVKLTSSKFIAINCRDP
jgi:hypothetical protein